MFDKVIYETTKNCIHKIRKYFMIAVAQQG